MKKWEYFVTIVILSGFIYCLFAFEFYRYLIVTLLTLSTLMFAIRLFSAQWLKVVEDWATYRGLRHQVESEVLTLELKRVFINDGPQRIKQIGPDVWTTHVPKKSDMLALNSGEVVSGSNLPDYISMANFQKYGTLTKMFVGVGDDGPVYVDFTRMVHTIVAGATGSGKSNFVHILMTQILSAKEAINLDLIDCSSNTFVDYPVSYVTEIRDIEAVFRKWMAEFSRRIELFSGVRRADGLRVKDIWDYNGIADEPLPYSIMFIEEGAELFSSEYVIETLGSLLRGARKVGLQIVLIAQSAKAVELGTSQRNNLVSRVQFPTKENSLKRMLVNAPPGSLNNIGRAYMDLDYQGEFLVQTPEIDTASILAVSRHESINQIPEVEVIDMAEPELPGMPEVGGETTREKMANLAEEMTNKGINLDDIKPVEVIKHLKLNGNGREYRMWDQLKSAENGLVL